MVTAAPIPRQRLRSPLVVASDIHLRSLGDSRGQLLLEVLSRVEAGTVEYLVLNGDIFDFCFGESRYFQDKYRLLGEALAALVRGGTRVLFVEGNHDFHMRALTEKGGWDGVEIVSEPSRDVVLRDGTTIKFGHGDLIQGDWAYRLFRGLVKSDFVRWLARLVPGRWLDAYALRHAQVSRAAGEYRKLDHHKLLAAANKWVAADGESQHGIFGHFHVPYAEPRETGEGLLLSVESWEKPNLLVYEDGEFFRIFFDKPAEGYVLHRVEALFS
jgi:UDP-2,3-diacylglucosamine hydrolase